MSKTQRRWTASEDAILREGVRLQEKNSEVGATINWNEIAKKIPGRNNKDCRKRYYNEVAGGLKKGPWTEEEDARLKEYVSECGLSWAMVAQKMENRSADQCSKRWHHCLDPNLERRPWTDKENQMLLTALAAHGSSWKDIQTIHFPTRSANNVKNQYTILARKYATVPPDAPPCCPQGSPAPEPQSPPPSRDSEFLDLDNNSLMNMDSDFSAPKSSNHSHSGSHFTHFSSTDAFPLSADTPSELSYGPSSRWSNSNSSHDLTTMFSTPELDMSDLDVPNFSTSTTATCSVFGAGPGEFDAASLTLSSEYFPSLEMDGSHSGRHHSSSDAQDFMTLFDDSSKGTMLVNARDLEQNGLSKGAVAAGANANRITITIDDAEPHTVMGVMQVLVQSRAKVKFQTTT